MHPTQIPILIILGFNTENNFKLLHLKRESKGKGLKFRLNCLYFEHETRDYRSQPCKMCKNKHNSVFHIDNQVTLSKPIFTS